MLTPVTSTDADPRDNPAVAEAAEVSLRNVFAAHRWRILLTYLLFCIESSLRLAQPLVIGLAINDLLQGSYRGMWWFLGQHLAHLTTGTLRQMYDTRTFSQIYTGLASDLVLRQRQLGVPTSSIVARSTMSREFVDFFERHVPMAMQSVFSIAGALAILAWYDWLLVPVCLGLLFPAAILNRYYGRRTLFHSRRLHDQFEREVDLLAEGRDYQVQRHYATLARCRVSLSDCEAVNFALMELFVMAVIAGSLIHYCLNAAVQPGDVFAVFRYVLMFVMGLDSLPLMVAQFSRLRDIGRRMQPDRESCSVSGSSS